MSTSPITFVANFHKITTLVDGGWRISLDVSQTESDAILTLSKHRDTNLQCALIVVDEKLIETNT